MVAKATSRGGWRRALAGALLATAVCVALTAPRAWGAPDDAAAASELSNRAFAMLNALNAAGAEGTTSPVIGEVASFAGDAQSLSQALSKGDRAGAGRAMALLKADEAALDRALRAHSGAVKAADWDSLKQQLAALEKRVPAAAVGSAPERASAAASLPPPAAPGAASPESASGAAPDGSGVAAGTEPEHATDKGPRIEITSRSVENGAAHIKGYFEGTFLKSAGIYEGARRVKPIKVDKILGFQKVEFDLALNGADVATNLRVYDHAGRRAIASVYAGDTTALAGNAEEGGVEVNRGSGATSGGNTAEIPSMGSDSLDSPGPLSGGGSASMAPMGNVQINVTAVNVVDALAHVYQVSGQISGRGVRRAGIYVDGRLVKRLPVASGASVSAFNATFIMNGGTATIRAFGAGNRYVESSIGMPGVAAPPMVASPYAPYYSPYGANPYSSAPSLNINIGPGVSPYGMNPYGVSPYGGLYGSPYGMNPYASPYGVSPYGAPPAAHPWGNAPAPPSASGR